MLNNKTILLAGIDLDGTLLRDDKTVSEASLKAIEAAYKKGIAIVPVTGRPMAGVPDFIKNHPAVEYIVTSNGAYITNVKKNQIIYSKQIDNADALKYIRLANECGLFCEAFTNGYGYIDERTMERHVKSLIGTPLYEYVISSRSVVNDVYEYFKLNNLGADELFCIAESEGQRTAFRKQIENEKAIKFCELEDVYIELSDAQVDKGETLKRLCNHLNVPIENTIAFGDGENDLTFMHSAGVSVAMGNAKQMIKASADLVTDTNENDGVAKILTEI